MTSLTMSCERQVFGLKFLAILHKTFVNKKSENSKKLVMIMFDFDALHYYCLPTTFSKKSLMRKPFSLQIIV